MEEKITKELLQKLTDIKGETRGVSFKADGEFILKEKGEEGLVRLKKRMAELGYPLEYKKIKATDFYPLGLRGIELVVIKELFNFSREDFARMGVFQTKTSLIIKLFMKFFVSLDALAEKAPEIWKRYYTTGTLEVAVFNKEEKNGILAVKNFALHPLHCQLLEGYFGNMIKMVVGTPVVCEEKKCTFKGDDCHEFFVKW